MYGYLVGLGTTGFKNNFMLNITKKPLSVGQYVREESKKTAVVIHHTAGSHRPDSQISYWDSDLLGRVATHYVIGGISSDGKDKTYDGDIFQAYDEKFYAFHLGVKGNENRFDKQSISIELCNYGYLVLGKNGKFYNYVQKEVVPEQVVDLGYVYRGFRYWHKYTDNQILSLKLLLQNIILRQGIDKNFFGFDFSSDLLSDKVIKGIYTHVNFRKDKFDCSPQPNLVKMLENL